MLVVDNGVLVCLLAHDDARQVKVADQFIARARVYCSWYWLKSLGFSNRLMTGVQH